MVSDNSAKITRRKYLKYGLGAVAGAAVVALGYGFLQPSKPTSPTTTTSTSVQGTTSESQPVKEKSVIIGSGTGFGYLPMYIGVSKGYFEDQKLNVQWPKFSGGANSMAALIGKQADFSLQGYSHIVTAFNKGAKVKMVAILINKEHSEYVMRKQVADKRAITVDSSLEAKAKAAKGLTIGVTSRGSKSDSDIRFFLKHYGGLDPDKDVNIIVAPGDYASVKAAFERGDLDIYNKGAPAPQQLIADGLAISYLKGWADAPEGMPEGVNTILTEVAARYETIQNDPDLVQRVVNAFAKTLKFMNKSPDEVQQLLPSLFPDTSADILTAIWHDLRPVFPANPLCKPNEKGMTADQDLLIGTGVLKQPIPLENTYDDEFAEAAKV